MSGIPLFLRESALLQERFYQGFAGNIGAGQQNALSVNIAKAGQNRFGDILVRDEARLHASFRQSLRGRRSDGGHPGLVEYLAPFAKRAEPLPGDTR